MQVNIELKIDRYVRVIIFLILCYVLKKSEKLTNCVIARRLCCEFIFCCEFFCFFYCVIGSLSEYLTDCLLLSELPRSWVKIKYKTEYVAAQRNNNALWYTSNVKPHSLLLRIGLHTLG